MNSYHIVLVEPAQPGNIGAICRAMANFGVEDLRLVNPACDHLDPEAFKMAVFAHPLLEKASIYASLPDALADCHFAVAATRRQGGCRGDLLPLTTAAGQFADTSAAVALVFGRERSGLTSSEVNRCSHAAAIETAADGSLNLAQAVLVFLYEFTKIRAAAAGQVLAANTPLQGDFDGLFRTMENVLDRTGYLNRQKPEALMHPLRRIFRRAGLSRDELNLLRGIWSRLEESVQGWPGKRRGGGAE